MKINNVMLLHCTHIFRHLQWLGWRADFFFNRKRLWRGGKGEGEPKAIEEVRPGVEVATEIGGRR